MATVSNSGRRLVATRDDIELEPQATWVEVSPVDNSFCPTGLGGGIDPSCGKSDLAGQAASVDKLSKKDLVALAKQHDFTTPEKVPEKRLRKVLKSYLEDKASFEKQFGTAPSPSGKSEGSWQPVSTSSGKSSKSIIEEGKHLSQSSDQWQQQVADPIMQRIQAAPSAPGIKAALEAVAREHNAGRVASFISLSQLHKDSAAAVETDSFLKTVLEGVQSGRYRLHPYTGSRANLKDHEHTIPTGREYMQYLEILQ